MVKLFATIVVHLYRQDAHAKGAQLATTDLARMTSFWS